MSVLAIDERDLVVDTFTAGIGNPVFVRITHRPTGVKGEGTHRSSAVAKRIARNRLEVALIEAHSVPLGTP